MFIKAPVKALDPGLRREDVNFVGSDLHPHLSLL
jgi:hypothetical protein